MVLQFVFNISISSVLSKILQLYLTPTLSPPFSLSFFSLTYVSHCVLRLQLRYIEFHIFFLFISVQQCTNLACCLTERSITHTHRDADLLTSSCCPICRGNEKEVDKHNKRTFLNFTPYPSVLVISIADSHLHRTSHTQTDKQTVQSENFRRKHQLNWTG